MKRSGAIEILREIFLTHMNCDPGCCKDDETMYSKMLSEIEDKIGMLPPHSEEAERKLRKKYRGVPGYYSDGNNWEPE